MATNLSKDTDLLEEALNIGGLTTKKDTVNQALKEYVQRRKLKGGLILKKDAADQALKKNIQRRRLKHKLTIKKDTVNQALKEYVQWRKQKQVVNLFGSLPADSDYNYKKGR